MPNFQFLVRTNHHVMLFLKIWSEHSVLHAEQMAILVFIEFYSSFHITIFVQMQVFYLVGFLLVKFF